jgi:hypothetical protein
VKVVTRIAVTALAFVSLIGVVAQPGPATAASPFTDIGQSAFQADIEWLYAEGITAGCTATRFCPTATVTRAQMASFLARMFELDATSTDYFTDDESSSHEASINRVRAAGITGGCTPTTFCPEASVTREQMAAFLVRAAELTEGAGRNYFYDDNGRSLEVHIDRAAAAGIASGCATWRFCPTRAVTREQMAAFLHRVVDPVSPPGYPAPPPPTPKPTPTPTPKPTTRPGCDPSYPTVCIPPPPPDLDCPDVPYDDFKVQGTDPHRFDGDNDGVGCES